MEGSNTVIDNRPSVKVFYDCDHLSEADFVSVLLGICLLYTSDAADEL